MFIEITVANREEKRLINCNHITDISEEDNTQTRLWFADEVSLLIENKYQEIKRRLINANLFVKH